MKISGDKLIEVYHTWLKDYFSNVRLTSSKVNWLKLPLAKNAPVSPIGRLAIYLAKLHYKADKITDPNFVYFFFYYYF